MTSSLFTRIEKLETRHRNDGHVLLLWIKSDEDIDAAVLAANTAGLFASGDLVICAEWLGDDPMPRPRWLERDDEWPSEKETDYIIATVLKRAGGRAALTAVKDDPDVDLKEISRVDLMHCVLGVKT
jgi:hypothetical protein